MSIINSKNFLRDIEAIFLKKAQQVNYDLVLKMLDDLYSPVDKVGPSSAAAAPTPADLENLDAFVSYLYKTNYRFNESGNISAGVSVVSDWSKDQDNLPEDSEFKKQYVKFQTTDAVYAVQKEYFIEVIKYFKSLADKSNSLYLKELVSNLLNLAKTDRRLNLPPEAFKTDEEPEAKQEQKAEEGQKSKEEQKAQPSVDQDQKKDQTTQQTVSEPNTQITISPFELETDQIVIQNFYNLIEDCQKLGKNLTFVKAMSTAQQAFITNVGDLNNLLNQWRTLSHPSGAAGGFTIKYSENANNFVQSFAGGDPALARKMLILLSNIINKTVVILNILYTNPITRQMRGQEISRQSARGTEYLARINNMIDQINFMIRK